MDYQQHFDLANLYRNPVAVDDVIKSLRVDTLTCDFKGHITTTINDDAGQYFSKMYYSKYGSTVFPDYVGLAFMSVNRVPLLKVSILSEFLQIDKNAVLSLYFGQNDVISLPIHPQTHCALLDRFTLKQLASTALEKWRLDVDDTFVVGDNTLFTKNSVIKSKQDWQRLFKCTAALLLNA